MAVNNNIQTQTYGNIQLLAGQDTVAVRLNFLGKSVETAQVKNTTLTAQEAADIKSRGLKSYRVNLFSRIKCFFVVLGMRKGIKVAYRSAKQLTVKGNILMRVHTLGKKFINAERVLSDVIMTNNNLINPKGNEMKVVMCPEARSAVISKLEEQLSKHNAGEETLTEEQHQLMSSYLGKLKEEQILTAGFRPTLEEMIHLSVMLECSVEDLAQWLKNPS